MKSRLTQTEACFLACCWGARVSHAVFIIIDENHYLEDWTFMQADGTLVRGHLDFRRVQ